MAKLFISQERLDAWSGEARVALAGDLLTLVSDGRSFQIRPAVRFLQVVGGDPDPNGLIETVHDEHDLARMGADSYMTSVIVGDTSYQVQPGFLGEPLVRRAGCG
jgi:hypothetical protein